MAACALTAKGSTQFSIRFQATNAFWAQKKCTQNAGINLLSFNCKNCLWKPNQVCFKISGQMNNFQDTGLGQVSQMTLVLTFDFTFVSGQKKTFYLVVSDLFYLTIK